MDTLNALRAKKAAIAGNSAQTTPSAMGTKALEAQSKAAQIENQNLRTYVKTLEERVKVFEGMPAQVTALEDLVKQQDEHSKAQSTKLDEVLRRLSALEDRPEPNPTVEIANLTQLQADIKAVKQDVSNLGTLSSQLKQLQSTTTQHGKDIVNVNAMASKLRTDLDAHGREQAGKSDAVKAMVQTAIQPEIKKMNTSRDENTKTLADATKKVEANQRVINNLSSQLQTLQVKVNNVESNDSKTYQKLTTLEESFKERLQKVETDNDELFADIRDYIGPIRKSYQSTKDTLVQRIHNLEEKAMSYCKEQDHLSGELSKLSAKTDKQPTDSVELAAIVSGLGEDTKKLTTDFEELQATVSALQQRIRPADEQNKLVERMSSLSNTLDKIRAKQREQNKIVGQVKSFQSEQSKLGQSQKTFLTEQTRLSIEQAEMSDQQVKIGERVLRLERASELREVSTRNTEGSTSLLSGVGVQQPDRSFEERITGELGQIRDSIDELKQDSEQMESDIDKHETDMAVLRSSFADIFTQHFDPFKARIEQYLELCYKNITEHAKAVTKLGDEVTKLQAQPTSSGLTDAQFSRLNEVSLDIATLKENLVDQKGLVDAELQRQKTAINDVKEQMASEQDSPTLKQTVADLHVLFHTTVEQLNSTAKDLKEQVASKQDAISAKQSFDSVKATIRNLQHQYENIFTDDLHQRMVHWFLQEYPSTPANLVRQFAAMQHEVAQIQTLVQSPEFKKINQTMAETQKKHANLTQTVASLKSSVDIIRSDATSFAKADLLVELGQSVRALQAGVRTEHDERVKVEKAIQLSITDLETKKAEHDELEAVKTDLGNKIGAASEHVAKLETALTEIRTDFSNVVETFITPNTEFLNRFSLLFVVALQLQEIVQMLNQNLPNGPLVWEWNVDLSASLGADTESSADTSNAATPGADDNRKATRKGKGKGKQL
jgi:chromosome segregation ATPase